MIRPLTLYRGIAVPAKDLRVVSERIQTAGILGTEGTWSYRFRDLGGNVHQLFARTELSCRDLDEFPGIDNQVGACGDEAGASYYACRHNMQDGLAPLVVEFQALVAAAIVDGRDFLFTAFQLWDQRSDENRQRQRAELSRLFGTAVLRYFDRACGTRIQDQRIALCHLAIQDPEVVEAHARNRRLILGRHGTTFCSAFLVRAPIGSDRINRVFVPSRPELIPQVTLQDFLAGHLAETVG